MYRFIESIKIHKKRPYLLEWHQKRMNETFHFHGKTNPLQLAEIFTEIPNQDDGLLKWRILYDLDGNFSTELIPYSISEIKTFELIINNSILYPLKSEDRNEINTLKANSKADEIIIVKNNHITDTSFSNLLFKKGKHWVTPKTYLLNGVQRQFLLSQNLIEETDITLEHLKNFSHIKIINAMNSFDDQPIYSIDRIVNLY